MTRDEWYKSVEFHQLRLLNNMASEVQFKIQHLYDVVGMIHATQMVDNLAGVISDQFSLMERQLRIVQLEAKNLVDRCNEVERRLRPKIDDGCDLKPTQDSP